MARKISAKINLSKIDKSRIFTSEKGNKYLDIMIIETPGGKYGDWLITEQVSKQDYDRGVKGNILGNGKNMGDSGSGQSGSNYQSSNGGGSRSYDDMPF